jgi:Tfp pilus assembly protein PilV
MKLTTVNDSLRRRLAQAFTLLEVMIAAGILFICLFAILALLANTLRNARYLQHRNVSASIPATELSLTNRLSEGSDSGDFGDMYPDYKWASETQLASTNGLFLVDFVVTHRSGQSGDRANESHMTILLYRPDSPTRPGGGAPR